jgi:hypothetical protein
MKRIIGFCMLIFVPVAFVVYTFVNDASLAIRFWCFIGASSLYLTIAIMLIKE